LVSHDRAFLNNVVTSSLVFEGKNQVNEYIGGYDDWLKQRRIAAPTKSKAEKKSTTALKPESKPVKRSYKDQRDLDNLPKLIEELDAELESIQAEMANPDFYKLEHAEVTAINARMAEVEEKLAAAYVRWEELEE